MPLQQHASFSGDSHMINLAHITSTAAVRMLLAPGAPWRPASVSTLPLPQQHAPLRLLPHAIIFRFLAGLQVSGYTGQRRPALRVRNRQSEQPAAARDELGCISSSS